ncbi:MAG: hypothetical protein JNM10_05320 [Planctomycetia bacterium]|nr:hypothetical protein [Planctomycetia bacterium]
MPHDLAHLRAAAADALPRATDGLDAGRVRVLVLRQEPAFAPWVRLELLAPSARGGTYAVRRSTWRSDVDGERTRAPNVCLDGTPTIDREARAVAPRGWARRVAAVAAAAGRCGDPGDLPILLDATAYDLEVGGPSPRTLAWSHVLPRPWSALRRPLAALVAAVERALAAPS